jgi:autotransporter-associated beta strand protein
VADQGRAIAGLGSLDGPSQTLPDLYKLPAAEFHDILYDSATNSTAGNTLPGPTTGPSLLYSPGQGYDLATGLGSPVGNLLISQLVTGPASRLVIAQGPTGGLAGASLTPTITVDVDDASGNLVVTDDSSVTLSIGNNPTGGNALGTRTVAAVNGVATFSGLSIDTAGNGYTLIASDGGLATATSAAFNIAVNSAQPTVATPASAAANPVSGTTSSLSVLGADPTGEANLTYSWSALSLPSGASAPAFSPNQTNAAKNTTATFSSAGTYVFLVTITNANGLSKASTVSVTVSPILTALAVTPGPVTLSTQSQQQFTATQLDQFGNAMGTPPATTWSAGYPLAGGGTITPSGLYTAPAAAGSDTVTAQSGALLATASVTIAAPVGWWKLNEGTGTTADDLSASGDNGTIVNGTWLQPPNGFNGAPALQFNGQSSESPSVVKLGGPAVLNFSGQITLSAWIKPASITQSQYILNHRANTANDLFLMINGNGTYQVGVESNGTFYGASASIPPQDLNAWVHLAGTYDGTTWRLYRDGQLVASSTASIGAISMSPVGIYKPTWGIGAATSYTVTGLQYFDGVIDDVRIYNTAISSSDISGLEAIPPTVATPAAASPETVTGTTAALSVLGADAAGESTLTYTWATTGTPPGYPPGAVSFSANGTQAARNTTATFTAAGTYNFLVTIANAAGLTAAGSVSVTVNQTLTSIIVAGQPLAATAYDQFGNPLANQPAYDSGSDTISAALALASNVTVVPAAGSQLTLSGGISGAGPLTVDTQGTVVLTGVNSYTGGTTVSAGKLILTGSSAIAANSSLTVGANLSLFAPSSAASPSAVPAVATPAPNTVAAGTPSGLYDSPFAVPPDASPKGASATNAPHRCLPAKGGARGTPSHTSRSIGPTAQPFSLPKDGPPVRPARTSASSIKAAGDFAWLPQVADGSDNSDPNRKRDVAILALDAVFAQYGR